MQQDMSGEVFEIMVTLGNDILAPDTHIKEWYTVESWGLAEQGCDGPNAVYMGLLAFGKGIVQFKASDVLRVRIYPPAEDKEISEGSGNDSVH